MSTKQFKMYLDDELVERLELLAKRTGRRSAQQVAEEVLDVYLPVWTAVADATSRAMEYQATVKETQAKGLAPVVAHIEPSRDEVRRQFEEEVETVGTKRIPIRGKVK